MADLPKWGEWTDVNGVYVRWLKASPNNTNARCERCSKPVSANTPRVWIDNGRGQSTKRSHGKRNEKVCTGCAIGDGIPEPAPEPDWW